MRLNDKLNAFIADDTALGVHSAPALGPLSGLTIGVKDNIDVAGFPTRAGLGCRGAAPARADAACVAALRAAGGRILGKLGMDEAALGAAGDNPHTGRVLNPRDPVRSAGGSSAGAGAAIAAGLCDIALGTDTLGSVRIPASYCGVLGFKPSPAAISRRGVVPLAARLDAVGLLAGDLATLRRAAQCLIPNRPRAARPLGALCVAVPLQIREIEMEAEIAAAFDAWSGDLARHGATVETVDLGGWAPMATARAGFLLAEAEAAKTFAAELAGDDPALSPALRKLLRYGRDCGGDRIAKATRIVNEAGAAWIDALARFDVLALPTTPQVAFRFEDGAPANQGAFTAPANCAGAPAISLPLGRGGAGLPVGLQLVAAPGRDADLLAMAAALSPR